MLLKCCINIPSIWKTQQWPWYWKRSVFISIPKNIQTTTVALISHASKVMLKNLQARLQQYMNWELPDIQAGFRKGRGTRDQIANIHRVIEKAREFQKNIYFFTDYAKAFDYVKAFDCADHNRLWKIHREIEIPHYFTCLLRILYTRHKQYMEPDVEQRTGSKLRKECTKAVYCHPVYSTYM